MTDQPDPTGHGRFCGARKRQGEGTCTRPAGWGTSHPGYGTCKLHLGSSPSGEAAAGALQAAAIEVANRERALEAVRTWSPDKVPNDPGDVLLKVTDACFTNAVLAQARLYELPKTTLLDKAGREYTHPLVVQVQTWWRMAAETSAKAVGADLMGRHLRLMERYGDSVAAVAEAMVREFVPGADVTDPEVRRRIRRVLLQVAGGEAGAA
jgi:hypothetical protein